MLTDAAVHTTEQQEEQLQSELMLFVSVKAIIYSPRRSCSSRNKAFRALSNCVITMSKWAWNHEA